jgi:uncharacterized protein with GYD domain
MDANDYRSHRCPNTFFSQTGPTSDTAKRLDAGLAMGKQQGCVYEKFFMTMGSFDMVSIVDAPDDETLAKHVLAVGAGGNVRTITLKAFPEEVYRSIIADV